MQGNRFFYEQGKLLLDGGGEGRFELRALGNNAYRLMEAPRRFVFTFFTRRDGSLAVRVDVEGSPCTNFAGSLTQSRTLPRYVHWRARYFSAELEG